MSAAVLLLAVQVAGAQVTSPETPEQKIARLSAALAQTQAQMSAYQAQVLEMQRQLAALEEEMHRSAAAAPAAVPHEAASSSLDEVRERQAIEESQIATHEQSKVETQSKYPVKVSGLLLFNAFVNTRRVDDPINPTYSLPGSGTTGLSMRQTVLGFDARGPHLLGASSHADLRADFFGPGLGETYGAGGVFRLRTAHAALTWGKTQAFAEIDRPLIAPNVATSLVSAAQPNFAWSGDLWTWNPQIGVTHELGFGGTNRLRLQAALIDVQDPLLPNATSSATASRAQRSRWPGAESRVAFASGEPGVGPEVGVGGYFSPHRTGSNARFDSWAATADLRLPMGRHFEFTGNAYRGQGLGGLGGGGYVDYFYRGVGSDQVAIALNDVGGWAQLKGKASERLQFNAGYGIDNPFASDIRAAGVLLGPTYTGLTKNRSAFGNVIYSPSSYLLFSLEYRRLWSNYQTGPTTFADAIGIGAGYKF